MWVYYHLKQTGPLTPAEVVYRGFSYGYTATETQAAIESGLTNGGLLIRDDKRIEVKL